MFVIPCQEWTILNRIRTIHERCRYVMYRCNCKLKDKPNFDCGNDSQTMRHITDEWPNRRFVLDINVINEVAKKAIEWIKTPYLYKFKFDYIIYYNLLYPINLIIYNCYECFCV